VDADRLKKRTQLFALNIIKFVQTLPDQDSALMIGRQLLKCGTSVGANYRAACRAKSRADFIAKLKIVEEECDESVCWMELLAEIRLVNSAPPAVLIEEASQILSIVVASLKTARASQSINRQS
jgi:four helix bundle protein